MTDLDTGADLRALMDRALTDLPTPHDRLYDGAVRRGRPLRRRRRAAGALATAAVVAALAAVAVPLLGAGGPTAGDVAQDPATSAPRTAERPPGWWNMPGRVMEARLDKVLPARFTIADANLGDEELAPGDQATGGWLQVDLVDSHGDPAGGVNVLLYPPSVDNGADVREHTTCPGNLDHPTGCTEVTNAAGQVVGRSDRSVTADGVVVTEVTRLTPEGAVIYMAASNSSDDKWGLGSSIDRTNPPLNLAALATLVEDPTWRDWADQG